MEEAEQIAALVDEVATAVAERMGAVTDRPLYSPKTLAEKLAVSERTVRQFLADGVIPSFTVGNARRVSHAAVEAYLAERQADEG